MPPTARAHHGLLPSCSAGRAAAPRIDLDPDRLQQVEHPARGRLVVRPVEARDAVVAPGDRVARTVGDWSSPLRCKSGPRRLGEQDDQPADPRAVEGRAPGSARPLASPSRISTRPSRRTTSTSAPPRVKPPPGSARPTSVGWLMIATTSGASASGAASEQAAARRGAMLVAGGSRWPARWRRRGGDQLGGSRHARRRRGCSCGTAAPDSEQQGKEAPDHALRVPGSSPPIHPVAMGRLARGQRDEIDGARRPLVLSTASCRRSCPADCSCTPRAAMARNRRTDC